MLYVKVRLTNKNCYQKSSHPLLLYLLDAWFIARCHSFTHDSKGIGVGHRAHGCSSQPGQAKQSRNPAHGYDDQQVQMKPRALHQHPLLFTHDKAENEEETPLESESLNFPTRILITHTCITRAYITNAHRKDAYHAGSLTEHYSCAEFASIRAD